MKKSLLAVAAIGAFASAAQAQSSVTVYGILDAGYVGGNSSYVVPSATAGKSTATKTTGNQFTDSAESSSRLGFKGTEDLGGGTSAFFTLEVSLTPNATSAFNTGTTANRQAFVGLKKNGLGDFAVGTQYTPIFNAVAATTAAQVNNMVGDVIYSRNSLVPGAQAAAPSASSSGNDNNASFTARSSNTLTLNTDTFAGFKGHAIWVAANVNTNQTSTVSTSTAGTVVGGTSNQNGWGLGADYTYNKFFIAGAYQSFSATNPYAYSVASNTVTFTTGAPTLFGQGGSNALGTNVRDNQGYVGATYDFGILKAYANWVSRKATLSENSNFYVKRQAEQIGVRSYLTPTIEAWAVAGLGRYTAFGGASQPTANFNAYQLGANYYLSKRTNLYAIWGVENTSTYNTYNLAGQPTGSNSANTNGYALGMRHTF